ncbi:RGS domain-containing protein [Paraphysoderma sedebokerense]|nr:RGS domain-containing protein [Paraphysoderma sedebokerense]
MKLEQTTALMLFYPIFAIFLASYALKPWFGHVIFIIALITINHTVSITIPALYAFFRGGHENIHVEQSMESFQRVLNDRDMFQRFKIILAEDFSIENAMFLEEYNTLAPNSTSKTTQTILDAESTKKHIEYIVNNFIISGSPYELNLSSKTRKSIISEAKKDNYTIEILEPAKNEVTQLMYLNSFPRFIRRMSVTSSVTGTKTSTVH